LTISFEKKEKKLFVNQRKGEVRPLVFLRQATFAPSLSLFRWLFFFLSKRKRKKRQTKGKEISWGKGTKYTSFPWVYPCLSWQKNYSGQERDKPRQEKKCILWARPRLAVVNVSSQILIG